MLSARVYSFRLKSRLAVSLSWVAGYANVIAFTACGVAVSHVTGNATHVGQHMFGRDAPAALFCAFLVSSFFCGAALAGLALEVARRRGFRSKYILPVTAEAALLALFALGLVLHRHHLGGSAVTLYWMSGVASAAMGLQNATVTRISGAVVRTTHLTGVVTDLGLEGTQLLMWYRDKLRLKSLSRAARVLLVTRRHPTAQRVALLAGIVGSFLFGTFAGALAYEALPDHAMILPVAFLLWMVWVDWRKPIADVRELDLLGGAADAELVRLGDLRELLPAGVGLHRLAHHKPGVRHGAPDFQQWADRLPRGWRVVILAVSPLTHFDADAVLDLRAAVGRLRESRRRVVLCGVTQRQFKLFQRHGLTEVVDVEDVCTDLEFALARAMEVHRQMGERASLAPSPSGIGSG